MNQRKHLTVTLLKNQTHFNLQEKRALLFVLTLPDKARKTIGAPKIARSSWTPKICMPLQTGPQPQNHPHSLWLLQCWRNLKDTFPTHLYNTISAFTMSNDKAQEKAFKQALAQHIEAIVKFYQSAQKLKRSFDQKR